MPAKKKAPAGVVCKHCGKGGFADAAGKMQHERRSVPADYGGRRADPKKPKDDEGDADEREPEREHPLNRRLFGSSGRAE